MEIQQTSNVENQYLKVLVYGASGAGKTRLASTIPDNIILSAESGLLSLKDFDIDYIQIRTMDDMRQAYEFLLADTKYKWVTLDSISEIAEVVLSEEKKNTKDPRKAYGEMQEIMTHMMRSFRDLNKNVYFSAKQDKVKDESTGGMLFAPSAPGQKLGQAMPYLFDEVFAIQVWKDEEGKTQRMLQTERDNQYEAKDRSGSLDVAEPCDLQHIFNKIMNKGE